MITLGYEDPVMMPTMLVYNTDLMKMYIAGVKEQYDNARADMKDFMKQYGDFYSPIAGDNEAYYNMTLGGANKMIADMMALGIDPYKSPEARNAIARYIASVPTGKIAQMKEGAEYAKQFIKNRDALIALNKWDPELDKILSGTASLDEWDTNTMGAWKRTMPYAKLNVRDVTNDIYKSLEKDENLGVSKNDPLMDSYGVSNTTLSIADTTAVTKMKEEYPLYYEKIWRPEALRMADVYNLQHEGQQGFIPVTADDMLGQMARSVNSDTWSQTKDVLNKDRSDAKSDARDWHYKQKEEALKHYYWKLEHPLDVSPNNSNSIGNNNNPITLSWTEVADNANIAANSYSNYTSQADAIKEALYELRNSRNEADKKRYYEYGKLYNILKKDDLTQDDKKWLINKGYVDANMLATNKFEKVLNTKYHTSVLKRVKSASTSKDIDKKISTADNLFTEHSSQLAGDYGKTARRLFTAADKTGDDVANIGIGDANLQYAPVAKMKMFGIVYKRTNVGGDPSTFVKFANMLKSENIPALDAGRAVRVSVPINGYRHISGEVKISLADFKKIASRMGYSSDKLINELGLTSTAKLQTTVKQEYVGSRWNPDNSSTTIKDEYVYIPMIRSIKCGPSEDAQINNSHMVDMMGKAYAGKNLLDIE